MPIINQPIINQFAETSVSYSQQMNTNHPISVDESIRKIFDEVWETSDKKVKYSNNLSNIYQGQGIEIFNFVQQVMIKVLCRVLKSVWSLKLDLEFE